MDADTINLSCTCVNPMSYPFLDITAHDLSVGYDAENPIISGFNANIERGQFVGVFGANGSGKTTLLRCLLGLLKPITGELNILENIPKRGDARIGYMPQSVPNLQVNISGRALLAATIQGHRFGLPWLSRKARFEMEKIVEFVGAQNLMDRPFMQLSGGERRRLLLAQALLGNPRILLLDEPLAHLDPHYQYSLIELLVRVQKEFGMTLLLTAHDINPLLGAMTKMLYLAGGKAILGDVDTVVNSDVLSHLYGSPIEVIRHQGRIFVMHSNTGQVENASCH